MSETLLILGITLFALFVLGGAAFFSLKKKVASQSQKLAQVVVKLQEATVQNEHLQRQVTSFESQMTLASANEQELKQTQKALEKRVTSQFQAQFQSQSKQLEQRIHALEEQTEQLINQTPQDKLYSRAVKLATMGASRDEIVEECGILSAEADMLLSIHQKS